MKGEVEWDDIVNIASAAYNSFPTGQSHVSAFFLLYGRDVYIPTLAS